MTAKSRTHLRPTSPCLLPEPRWIELAGGTVQLEADKLIVISSSRPAQLLFEAQEAQRALSEYADVTWHIYGSDCVPEDRVGLSLRLDPAQSHAQGYALEINTLGIHISAPDADGVFYGVMTLTQLLRQYGAALPRLRIEDYPDFPARGVMLDISRDKVPTMKTLFELVDLLAGLKINQFQLYTEHTFAYQRHPLVWANASPMTGEEILQLDAYCRSRHIELVPNQNSFGHMTRWLIHDAYRPLAEAPNGCDTRWGHFDQPFTLCPGDPGSLKLIGELYEELLPHFTSRLFNVGCDETVDLGQGRSKAECEARGTGVVYLEFLLKIYNEVRRHGRTMQFWGDIIMEHPELVPQLPKDVIALEWGYEHDHPFEAHGARFAESGVPFYVCPGTSSWNSIGGRTDNALGNLLNAAQNGLKHGAIGYLNTDWGDNGHHQPLPVSYLGYAYGAAVSWCAASNRDTDITRAVSMHLLFDRSGRAGRLAYDIGNIYRVFEQRFFNCTPYGFAIVTPLARVRERLQSAPVAGAEIARALREVGRLERELDKLELSEAPDGKQIAREWRFVLRLIRHGLNRLAYASDSLTKTRPSTADMRRDMRELIAEHKRVWLSRNRPGGLRDSAAVLERAMREYR
ncbi:MAG: glycoside hydrolase family 20 zincin-like fold domain-containing protein [Anaerolineae bacterium]|nr:family 20 glycosylhydrolase [Thermoflexales bacterium]MDW8406583.1 glycoside hydrolase family 20 zincin-like fold domain-containing protein [Anaerolineae bacterium]